MHMKHRWTGGLLLVAALSLGACRPADAGADDATPTPSAEATEATDGTDATDAPTMAPESETPEPAYEQDEY